MRPRKNKYTKKRKHTNLRRTRRNKRRFSQFGSGGWLGQWKQEFALSKRQNQEKNWTKKEAEKRAREGDGEFVLAKETPLTPGELGDVISIKGLERDWEPKKERNIDVIRKEWETNHCDEFFDGELYNPTQ